MEWCSGGKRDDRAVELFYSRAGGLVADSGDWAVVGASAHGAGGASAFLVVGLDLGTADGGLLRHFGRGSGGMVGLGVSGGVGPRRGGVVAGAAWGGGGFDDGHPARGEAVI